MPHNKQDVKVFMQASSGFYDLSEFISDFELRPGCEITRRRQLGAKSMFGLPVISYIESGVTGYLVQDGAPPFTTVFQAGERPLFAMLLPTQRVFAFKAYISADSIVEEDMVQIMDGPLEPTGGYMTSLTTTDSQFSWTAKEPSYLFYWLKKDISPATDISITSSTPNSIDMDINTVDKQAIGLLPIAPAGALNNLQVTAVDSGGNKVADDSFQWGIGDLR